MQNDLISRSDLDSFFYSETSGTDEMIENAVMKYPEMEMEFSDDCRALCNDIIEMCRNVIKTEPTTYDVEKVVAELEEYYGEASQFGVEGIISDIVEVVRNGGKE